MKNKMILRANQQTKQTYLGERRAASKFIAQATKIVH